MLQLSQILRLTVALPVHRLAVALLAAAALTACGGGGGSDSGSSQLDSRSPLSEERDTQTSEPGEQDDTADDPGSDTSDTTDEETGSDDTDQAPTDDDTEGGDPAAGDSDQGSDDSGSDSPDDGGTDDNTDTQNDGGSDDAADEDTASDDDSPADEEDQLYLVEDGAEFVWERPTQRENGDELEVRELGGYELRYREEGSQDYEVKMIREVADGTQMATIEDVEGVYEFRVAAFDSEGLYSNFVPIKPEGGFLP